MMVSEKTLHEDIIEKAWTDEHFQTTTPLQSQAGTS